jgi:flagellar basal body rod protein FlgC
MGLSSVAAIALQGLREQAKNLEATAGNIANVDSGEYQPQAGNPILPQGGEGVDLAAEMLGLNEGELAYRANAAVFEAGADLWDILGLMTRDE